MATTPTQMRLTDRDLARLEGIRLAEQLTDRTNVLRWLLDFYDRCIENEISDKPLPKKSRKKSSVAT